jgi:hypothetical protein
MEEAFWIWWYEQQSGPFTMRRLMSMAKEGEIDGDTLFWSDRRNEWIPLRGILQDLYPDRLDGPRQAGIKWVKFIDSGTGEDCEVCRGLNGKTFPIEAAPAMPPPGCECSPWCRSLLTTATDIEGKP